MHHSGYSELETALGNTVRGKRSQLISGKENGMDDSKHDFAVSDCRLRVTSWQALNPQWLKLLYSIVK